MQITTRRHGRWAIGLTWARIALAAGLIYAGVKAVHAAQPAGDDGKAVLIHTDAGDVTVADVRANLAALPPLTQITLLHDPVQLSNMVRVIAAQKLALKEALAKGWDKKMDVAAQVQAAEDRARSDVLLRSYISADSEPPADYPSDAELKAAYDAGKAKFTIPAKIHYAQIFIAISRGADKSAEDKASARLAGIETALKAPGADFGMIASTSSDDSVSATRRGDMGTLSDNQLPADAKPVLTALRPGDVSEPIRRGNGWYIFRVLDETPGRSRSLDEVRDELRTQLRSQKTEQNARARIDAFVQLTPKPSDDALAHLTNPAPQ